MIQNKLYLIFGLISAMLLFNQPIQALTITEPQPGAEFYPGDTVLLRAIPSSEENLKFVMFSTFGGTCISPNLSMSVFSAPYEIQCQIPREAVSGTMTISAIGGLPGDNVVEAKVSIRIIPPPTAILQKILVDPEQVVLFSPEDSSKLLVEGVYSDGVKRRINSSTAGTIYQTSDPKVAVVNSEGLVTAVATGRAVITVKNGSKEIQVRVIVGRKK